MRPLLPPTRRLRSHLLPDCRSQSFAQRLAQALLLPQPDHRRRKRRLHLLPLDKLGGSQIGTFSSRWPTPAGTLVAVLRWVALVARLPLPPAFASASRPIALPFPLSLGSSPLESPVSKRGEEKRLIGLLRSGNYSVQYYQPPSLFAWICHMVVRKLTAATCVPSHSTWSRCL